MMKVIALVSYAGYMEFFSGVMPLLKGHDENL